MDEYIMWIEYVAAVVLLVLSAFFSGSETALFAIPRLRLDALREGDSTAGRCAANLLARPNRLLIALLVGNLLVNVGVTEILGYRISRWCVERQWTEIGGYMFATGLMTAVLLVFGEITPKIIAVQNAERIGLLVARPISLFCEIIKPVQGILEVVTRAALAVMRVFRLRPDPFVTETHVLTALSLGEQYGVVEREERRMIQSVLDFTEIQAEHIMVPRPDMVTLPASATLADALETVNRTGYSRIPVYNDSVDDIAGIMYGKDLLPFLAKNDMGESVSSILRQPYFIPPTKLISELATELRHRKTHMAVVVDEYGGTAGLITLEDVLEEVVGEIEDETDVRRQMVHRVDDRTLLVDGRFELAELENLLGVEVPHHEHNTLAGLLMELLGHVPKEGEEVEFCDAVFVVEEVRARRVRCVRIVLAETTDKSEYEKDHRI